MPTAGTPSTCTGTYNANAGKSGNRTSQTVNGTTTTYCYDYADRLVSSSNANVTSAVYDSHGNTTSLGSGIIMTFTYDSSDRNMSITEGSKSTTYNRDVQGRLVSRTLANGTTTVNKYAYTSTGDTPDLLLDNSSNVVEKYLQLPGGVVLTVRSSSKVYSLPDIHGDVFAMVDASGGSLATFSYDPFGSATTTPNNTATGSSYGWVGRNEKLNEATFTLAPTQMGARVYLPSVGRFLQTDPIEGGTDNDYSYVNDPVNDFDLSGMIGWKKWFADRGKNVGNGVKKVQNFSDKHPNITNAVVMLATRGRAKGGGDETLRLPDELPLRGKAAIDAASRLGYNTRIPTQKAPFNSHGQPVFQNGNRYITPDIGTDGDAHKGGVWKMVIRQGGGYRRLGTYDENLNKIGD